MSDLSEPTTPTRRRRPGGSVPWIWVLPAVAVVLAFRYVATGAGTWYAFTDWDGLSDATWVGLDNFRQIFDDPASRGALKNTIDLAFTFVIASNVIGLALALALQRTVKTRGLLRALFFVPVVMSSLAVSYVWQFIFSFTGPLNQLLGALGLESWQRPWTGDPTWALWTIFVVLVWQFVGLSMVMYLAGLEGIPEELDEASAVDGASTFRRFRKITLPLLAPGDDRQRHAEHDLRARRLRPGPRRHGRRPRRRHRDARDADLQADVRLRPVRLRHGARARADRAASPCWRWPSSSSSAGARGGS